MLLLLAHLRYGELFQGPSSPRRIFPNLIRFLSSSTASQLRDSDNLCQVRLFKIRQFPNLPKGMHFIPRGFLIRTQLGVGLMRIACDILEDAVHVTQQSKRKGFFFNFSKVFMGMSIISGRRAESWRWHLNELHRKNMHTDGQIYIIFIGI